MAAKTKILADFFKNWFQIFWEFIIIFIQKKQNGHQKYKKKDKKNSSAMFWMLKHVLISRHASLYSAPLNSECYAEFQQDNGAFWLVNMPSSF